MAGADARDRGPRESLGIASHPEDERRILYLAQALRTGGATVGEKARAESNDARPFLFRSLTSLAIEDELRGFSGKAQALQFGKRNAKDLAGRLEKLNPLKNAFGSETGRQSEGQPRETVIIEGGGRRHCRRWSESVFTGPV